MLAPQSARGCAMTTETLTTIDLSPEIERALVTGDLSALTAEEKGIY